MNYYMLQNDEPVGPFGLQDMMTMCRAGTIQSHSMIAREGADDWSLAVHVPEIWGDAPGAMQRAAHGSPAVAPDAGEEIKGKAGIWIMAFLMPIIPIIVGLLKVIDPGKKNEGQYMLVAGAIAILIYFFLIVVLG